MAKQKAELGRGIRALLQSIDDDSEELIPNVATNNTATNSVSAVQLNQIEVNPFQPRVDFDQDRLEDLAQSIAVHGLIQPITVRRLENNKYQLISGERRLRASKMAGLEAVPAYIRTANDQEMLEMALIENIQREDLNPIEISINYQRLMKECELNQEQLAERVGKDRSTVANFLRLLKLPEIVQMALKEKAVSMGHARALLGLENVDEQLFIFKEIEKKNLSVRQVEQAVSQMKRKSITQKKTKQSNIAYEYQKVQDKLTSHFSTRIKLNRSATGRGEISIPFFSDEDLNRIIDIFNI
ncbi:MAG: putative chromosome-partitioning protein parB [Bacteroidota bacterium]|jgi:ParB family chromosome partitioning protein